MEATRLALFAWLSPAFPVGAYAYSHGLEWAAEAGDIRDEASLLGWISDLLEHGAGRNDAILLAAAWRAAEAEDVAAVAETNELALALAPSGELRLETAQQGRSFLDAVRAAWPTDTLERLSAELEEVAYPIALGLAAACHGLPLGPTAEAALFAFAQNLISAGLRLGLVGQTGGVRIAAALAPQCRRIAAEAVLGGLDDVGSATFRSDLGSLLHETQYTRLFRS